MAKKTLKTVIKAIKSKVKKNKNKKETNKVKDLLSVKNTGPISAGWVGVGKHKFPFVVAFEDFYLYAVDQNDEKALTELRNTGKVFGEINYDEATKPGVQGNVTLVALRK